MALPVRAYPATSCQGCDAGGAVLGPCEPSDLNKGQVDVAFGIGHLGFQHAQAAISSVAAKKTQKYKTACRFKGPRS